MLKHSKLLLTLVPASMLAALFVAGPAAAQSRYYAWRTEDGSYAFTDDAKAIPAAHRASAETRSLGSLRSYTQLTPSDARAARDYAARLDARLEHLRQLNAPPASELPATAAAASGPALSLRTGGDDSPLLQVAGDAASDEPMIVETLRAHPANKLVTRNNLVVRQGDRTLAIVRSRGREWNVAEDIHIEEDLE
jgi:hypothetical protein